jgi:hypothetical protein
VLVEQRVQVYERLIHRSDAGNPQTIRRQREQPRDQADPILGTV